MVKGHLRLVTPATVNRTVKPKRPPNRTLRTREYLMEAEVERLMNAAKRNRWGHPGRHDGLCGLPARPAGLRTGGPAVGAGGFPNGDAARPQGQAGHAEYPSGPRGRATGPRRLKREREPKSPFVFTSERGAPFSTSGFARMVERPGAEANLTFKAHPHMLRHACGYALANKGHDTRALQAYLGHRNIQHTVRYTELSPSRFKNFWRA
jgi:Phage integrase family